MIQRVLTAAYIPPLKPPNIASGDGKIGVQESTPMVREWELGEEEATKSNTDTNHTD